MIAQDHEPGDQEHPSGHDGHNQPGDPEQDKNPSPDVADMPVQAFNAAITPRM
jgi:hypothetical protein